MARDNSSDPFRQVLVVGGGPARGRPDGASPASKRILPPPARSKIYFPCNSLLFPDHTKLIP